MPLITHLSSLTTTTMYRIGAVPYLNAKPLIYKLKDRHDLEIKLATPNILARLLRRGEVDVALLSSIEYFNNHNYKIAVPVVIASREKTDSARLYHKIEPKKIKTVALDENSLTTNVLAQILLKKRYEIEPEYQISNPKDVNFPNSNLDAIVTIGDTSFGYAEGSPFLDLGSEWHKMTRLPFVYAFWMAPRQNITPALEEILIEATEYGMTHLRDIIKEVAQDNPLGESFITEYLTHSIHYSLGEDEEKSLRLFNKLALNLNLCKEEKSIIY